MKKTTNTKALQLKTEKVRALSDNWLAQAQGGMGPACPSLARCSCACNETTSTYADSNCACVPTKTY